MIISDMSRRGRLKRRQRAVTCAMCRSVRGKGYYGHLECSCCFEKLPVCVACLSGNNSGRQESVQLACDRCQSVVCTAGGCSTRCTDENCEAVHCSKCAEGMLECSTCCMPFCNMTETDCVVACEGVADCQNCICQLCEDGGRGCCEACMATICEDCRQVCSTCSLFTCCPDCGVSLQTFCEGCKVSKQCFECLLRRLPCEECGLPVSDVQLEKAVGSLKRFVEMLPRVETPEGDEWSQIPVRAHSTALGAYIDQILGFMRDRNKKRPEQQQHLHGVTTEERDDDNSETSDSPLYGVRVVHPTTTVGDDVTSPQHVTNGVNSDSPDVSVIPSTVSATSPPTAAARAPRTIVTFDMTAGPLAPATGKETTHPAAVGSPSQTNPGSSGSPIGIPVIGANGDDDSGQNDSGGGLLMSSPPLEMLKEGVRGKGIAEDCGIGYDKDGHMPLDVVQGTATCAAGRLPAKETSAGWDRTFSIACEETGDPRDTRTPAQDRELCLKQLPRHTASERTNVPNKAPTEDQTARSTATNQRIAVGTVADLPAAPIMTTETWPEFDANRVADTQTNIAVTGKTKGQGGAKAQAKYPNLQAKPVTLETVVPGRSESQQEVAEVRRAGAAATTERSTVQTHAGAIPLATTAPASKLIEAKTKAVPEAKHVEHAKLEITPRVTARVHKAKAAEDTKRKAEIETSAQIKRPELQAEENVGDVIAEGRIIVQNVPAQENAAATVATNEIPAPRARIETAPQGNTPAATETNTAKEARVETTSSVDRTKEFFSGVTSRVPAIRAQEDAKIKADAGIRVKDLAQSINHFVSGNVAQARLDANKLLAKVPVGTIDAKEEGSIEDSKEAPRAAGRRVDLGVKATVEGPATLDVQRVANTQAAVVERGKMGAQGDANKQPEGSEPHVRKIVRATVVKSRMASNKVAAHMQMGAVANFGAPNKWYSDKPDVEAAIEATKRAAASAKLVAEAAEAKAKRMADTNLELKVEQSTGDILGEHLFASNNEVAVICKTDTAIGAPTVAANERAADRQRAEDGPAVYARADADSTVAGEASAAGSNLKKPLQSADIATAKVNAKGEVSTQPKYVDMQGKPIAGGTTADGTTVSTKESSEAHAIATTETVTPGDTMETLTTISDARVAVDATMAAEARATAEARVAAEAARIADAKADAVDRATARVAKDKAAEDAKIKAAAEARAQAQAEKEAHRAERATRAKTVAAVKEANEARASAKARSEANDKAEAEKSTPGVTMKPMKTELLPNMDVMSLEELKKEAMDRGDVAAVEAIRDEAAGAPDLRKIKKSCTSWLKKHSNGRKADRHTSQPARMVGVRGAAGGRVAVDGAAAPARQRHRTIFCPQDVALQLVGHGVKSIAQWQKDTGATIKLKAKAHGDGSEFIITGSRKQVEDATQLIDKRISSREANSNKLKRPRGKSTARPSASTRDAPIIGRPRIPHHIEAARTMAGRRVRNGQNSTGGGGWGGLEDGGRGGEAAWGGKPVCADKMRELFNRADCRRHLNKFLIAKVDFDSIQQMEAKEYAALGLVEEEQDRLMATIQRMSKSTGEESENEVEGLEDSDICLVCMSARVEVMFIPCRHQVLCEPCSTIKEVRERCMICRQPIELVRDIYFG